MASKTAVKRPTSLHVSGIDWQIRWLTEAEWNKENLDEEARGLTRFNHRDICILLDATMSEAVIRDSFLHEVQHVVWDCAAMRHSIQINGLPDEAPDIEEHVIANTTMHWLNFIAYNPEAVEYLGGAN